MSSPHQMATDEEMKLQEDLFTNSMRGKWNEVIKEYSKDTRAHEMVITKSEDTALHLAIRENQEQVVSNLMTHIRHFKTEKVLEKKNERQYTPLHIAASLGSVRMCSDIAFECRSLVNIRNDDGETPLFLAALHGYKEAFLCLRSFCSSETSTVENCRRTDGDTVLHCAIRNEYFDLALQIICLNPEIASLINDRGFSPLHLLASNPAAFKSSTYIGRPWKTVVYECTIVDKLNPVTARPCCDTAPNKFQPKKDYFPSNYKTCMDFFGLLWKGILVVSQVPNCKKNLGNDESKKDVDLERNKAGESDYISRKKPEETENNLSNKLFPENYATCIHFLKVLSKGILIILGFGSDDIRKIREKKQKHTWSVQVMNALLENAKLYKYEFDGSTPKTTKFQASGEQTETLPYTFDGRGGVDFTNIEHQEPKITTDQKKTDTRRRNELQETPILIAAKNGAVEMVEKILQQFPVAIHDVNKQKKNVVLLAAENRQPGVYQLLLRENLYKESVLQAVDSQNNNALHLAANLGAHKPWRIAGAALQMQWELKWYKYVKSTMPRHCSDRYNDEEKIPKIIFQETHKDLVKSGSEWLASTAQNCSVVAALVVTVAFATAATVPGGNDQEKGTPLLRDRPAFTVFTISSLIALVFSVVSVLTFLAILTSRYEERDFKSKLPLKLLVGFFTLFFSIVAMLVSFCAGHFFLLMDHYRMVAFEVYTVVCVFVLIVLVIHQFPLYFDLLQSIWRKVPKRSSKITISGEVEIDDHTRLVKKLLKKDDPGA